MFQINTSKGSIKRHYFKQLGKIVRLEVFPITQAQIQGCLSILKYNNCINSTDPELFKIGTF